MDILNEVQKSLEGKIDFEGQKLTETITRNVLIGSTIISFIVGFAVQSLQVTFTLLGLSSTALLIVILPPWSSYNKHPIKWLPVIKEAGNDKKKK